MSAGSRKSSPPKMPVKSKTKAKPTVKRGKFDPAIGKAATKTASENHIILSREDGEWYGRGLELPNVFGDGTTADECVESTREALSATVAFLLESGKTPPAPAQQGLRTQQVNVRLTAEEKVLLESPAHSRAFTGLSDFIQAVVIDAVR
jgi:predicted RNase H-like HicB family nuclease